MLQHMLVNPALYSEQARFWHADRAKTRPRNIKRALSDSKHAIGVLDTPRNDRAQDGITSAGIVGEVPERKYGWKMMTDSLGQRGSSEGIF